MSNPDGRRAPAFVSEDGKPDFAALETNAIETARRDGYEVATIERAAEYAREEFTQESTGGALLALLEDFLANETHRGLVFERLDAHVEKREARDRAVDRLF